MITLSSPPVSLSYVSSGLFVAHDEWIHADRVIDSWELIYMLNGAVYMRQADVSYTLEKGDLLLLRPGVPHGGVQSSPLLTSNYSIKQLAAYLGWENENQFTHYFKYHEKMSPTQYRSLYVNTHLNKR